jgi:predicted Zn-ribbon and HTH transcriptional regulator
MEAKMAKQKIVKTGKPERKKAVLPKIKVKRIITTRSKDEKKTDIQFVAENLDALNKGDILNLKNKIQKVIDARKPTWWKCPKCGFVQKREWNAKPTTCLMCNSKNYQDGAWLEKMTAAEIEEHQKAERKKWMEWSKRQRRVQFENVNKYLVSVGDSPYTWEEFCQKKGFKSK